MTEKEKRQIDSILARAKLAQNKGADIVDILNAVTFDIHQVKVGADPEETLQLIFNEK